MSNPAPISNDATASTTDFLKLFMQELTYQDPLKPIDNREFMAQMAQFSALQATNNTNDLLKDLLARTSVNQSLALLGQQVKLNNSNKVWTVKATVFSANELKLRLTALSETKEINLGEIAEVVKGI